MRLPLALTLLAMLFHASPADACGGLFCSTTPVVQAQEEIIFDVDQDQNRVTAIINIVYQGSAEEFVWVLPLQTTPERIDTGSLNAFNQLRSFTAPRFTITEQETAGTCREPPMSGSVDAAASAPDSGANSDSGMSSDPGVTLVSRQDVGPYDTVVLQGSSSEAVKMWLLDNGFLVTDAMMELVTPYLAKGDTLLALKLLNDRDAGSIKPIEVEMRADLEGEELDACIPIRMTAMAANSDMPITTYVFADAGRAIPQNFFHVTPNLLKLDWLARGRNYMQLIADAIDEADAGHAFVTEQASNTGALRQLRLDQPLDEVALRSHTDLASFLQGLMASGLLRRPGMRELLEAHFPQIAECPGCPISEFEGQPIDPDPVVDEILIELIEPDRRAQEILDSRIYFTRLMTILDPEEMTVDPIFAYRKDLPEVSNLHTAKAILHCGDNGWPGSAGTVVILEDGRRIVYDGDRNMDPNIQAMPSALLVEQLYDDEIVKDNRGTVDEMMATQMRIRPSAGCGCSSTGTGGGAVAGLLLSLGLVLSGVGGRRSASVLSGIRRTRRSRRAGRTRGSHVPPSPRRR